MAHNLLRILLPVLVFSPAITLAQDSPFPTPATRKAPAMVRPSPAPKSIWTGSSQRVRVRTIKGQLGDLEARRAADDAERIRRRAACMLASADEIDKAAQRLDRVSKAGRDQAWEELEDATFLVDECDSEPEETSAGDPPEGRTQISGATASPGCAAGKDECQRAFDNRAWSQLLAEYREDLLACYVDGLDRRAHLQGVTRFMLRLGTGEHEGEVDRLRVEQDTVDDMEMLECQADVVQSMDFPPAAQGKTLRFTVRNVRVVVPPARR